MKTFSDAANQCHLVPCPENEHDVTDGDLRGCFVREEWVDPGMGPTRVLCTLGGHANSVKRSQWESVWIMRFHDDHAKPANRSKEAFGLGSSDRPAVILPPSSFQPHYRLAPGHSA